MARFQEVRSLEEWKNVFAGSLEQNTVVFKHSTTCPISACAWQEVQGLINDDSVDVIVALVKVIESRLVSNEISRDLEIQHQSPQAIVLCQKQVVWCESHYEITQENIKEALRKH